MPFKRPATMKDLSSIIVVEGGILTIHLKREDLIGALKVKK